MPRTLTVWLRILLCLPTLPLAGLGVATIAWSHPGESPIHESGEGLEVADRPVAGVDDSAETALQRRSSALVAAAPSSGAGGRRLDALPVFGAGSALARALAGRDDVVIDYVSVAGWSESEDGPRESVELLSEPLEGEPPEGPRLLVLAAPRPVAWRVSGPLPEDLVGIAVVELTEYGREPQGSLAGLPEGLPVEYLDILFRDGFGPFGLAHPLPDCFSRVSERGALEGIELFYCKPMRYPAGGKPYSVPFQDLEARMAALFGGRAGRIATFSHLGPEETGDRLSIPELAVDAALRAEIESRAQRVTDSIARELARKKEVQGFYQRWRGERADAVRDMQAARPPLVPDAIAAREPVVLVVSASRATGQVVRQAEGPYDSYEQVAARLEATVGHISVHVAVPGPVVLAATSDAAMDWTLSFSDETEILAVQVESRFGTVGIEGLPESVPLWVRCMPCHDRGHVGHIRLPGDWSPEPGSLEALHVTWLDWFRRIYRGSPVRLYEAEVLGDVVLGPGGLPGVPVDYP